MSGREKVYGAAGRAVGRDLELHHGALISRQRMASSIRDSTGDCWVNAQRQATGAKSGCLLCCLANVVDWPGSEVWDVVVWVRAVRCPSRSAASSAVVLLTSGSSRRSILHEGRCVQAIRMSQCCAAWGGGGGGVDLGCSRGMRSGSKQARRAESGCPSPGRAGERYVGCRCCCRCRSGVVSCGVVVGEVAEGRG